MKLKEIAKWIDMYLEGRLTDDQRKGMDDWLEKRSIKKPLADLEPANKRALKNRIYRKLQLPNDTPSASRMWFRMAAVAVAFCLVFLIGYLVINRQSHDKHKHILSDGTLVWLSPGSKLMADLFSPEKRQVFLTGEALFEVKKDSLHPFTIHCGSYVARVVGTSFSIRTIGERLELYVLTGKVKVTSIAADSTVEVKSNERVVMQPGATPVSKTPLPDNDRQLVIAHTDYDMHFQDMRVATIITRIEKKFNVRISLDNESIAECMISADFTDQSLEITLDMMTEALGLSWSRNEGTIVIKGDGCR